MTYSPQSFGIVTLGLSQASKFLSADSSGDLIMPDGDKIEFGSGSDMVMYHDDTNAYITNSKGALKLADQSTGIAISIGHTTSEVTVNDNLTVTGDLTVNGTTTTINSTTLTVDDLNIVLASGAADSSAADGAGITIDGASASLIYDHTGTQWEFNKPLEVTGHVLPNADATYDLGSTSLGWNDLHLGSAGILNFNNGDVLITHSANTLTVSGGTLATAALTASTGVFSGILKTDDTTDATSKTDGSLQTDGGLSVAKAIYNGTAATFAADSGIVTIGSSTAATFSAAGLLNINNATDATSTTDGSLQTDGGLSVVKDIVGGDDLILLTDSAAIQFGAGQDVILTHTNDVGLHLNAGMRLAFRDQGGEYLTSASDGHLEVNAGTTLDITAPTVDINASTAVTVDGPAFTIANSAASSPILHITNTHAGATSGELRFNKDSASGEDSDIMGLISFYGTDAGEATHERLAYVDAIITDSAAGSEAASLRFYVAENDATLTAGLIIAGQADDNGEVDVTIGAGAASTTTVAGNLTVTGDIILDDGGSLKEAGGTAAFTFDGSGNVTKIGQDSPSNGEFLKFDGTNWVAATATVSGLASDDLSVGDAAVTISTSSGNITIETQSSDTDIIFNVDDGGSQITALTLDGSDDGAAIFKSTIKGTVFKPAVEVVSSANVTISKGYTAISTAGSNRTATLPEATAALVGATYTVKKTDSGVGNVQVTAEGDGAIDTGTSVVLYHQFESVTVICRAADVWDIM